MIKYLGGFVFRANFARFFRSVVNGVTCIAASNARCYLYMLINFVGPNKSTEWTLNANFYIRSTSISLIFHLMGF